MKFRPGQSGNPAGRPKVVGELHEGFRCHFRSWTTRAVGGGFSPRSFPCCRRCNASDEDRSAPDRSNSGQKVGSDLRTPATSRALALAERTTKAHVRDSGPERVSRYALNTPRLLNTPVVAGSDPLRVDRLAAYSDARIKRLEVVALDRVPTATRGEGDGRGIMSESFHKAVRLL
jgi:hypothetical protein